MTSTADTPEREVARSAGVVGVLLIGWMTFIAVLGTFMALRIAGFDVLGDARRTFWDEGMVIAALLVYVSCLAPTLLAARV